MEELDPETTLLLCRIAKGLQQMSASWPVRCRAFQALEHLARDAGTAQYASSYMAMIRVAHEETAVMQVLRPHLAALASKLH